MTSLLDERAASDGHAASAQLLVGFVVVAGCDVESHRITRAATLVDSINARYWWGPGTCFPNGTGYEKS